MSNIEVTVEKLLKDKINGIGYKLYDVQYVKEGKEYFLRIFIDNEKGITLEDCEKVSNEISDLLDESDIIKEQYFLEVSSPGIERVLRRDEHLKDNINRKVQVNLFKPLNKSKQLIGKLKGYETEFVIIEIDNEIFNIDKKDIAVMKLAYEWDS